MPGLLAEVVWTDLSPVPDQVRITHVSLVCPAQEQYLISHLMMCVI